MACALKARHLKATVLDSKKIKEKEKKLSRECANCGKEFRTNKSRQRYCSPECQYEAALQRKHEKKLSQFMPMMRQCLCCGSVFPTTLHAKNKLFCSDECREKAEKEVRKEQMKEAFVEPVGLKTTYRDYKGLCAICGLPVPNTTEPSNQWAATVDHIIPLSKGGKHRKDNCQLAHRLCNSLKRDAGEEYKIDWIQKLADEPRRWNEQIDDLQRQLGYLDQK